MPNLVLLGHQWDTCSDMLPVNLLIPIVTYSCWLIPLAITTYIPHEPECYLNPGHTYYRIAITFVFTTFCAQLLAEILTSLLALRGTPLETKKRWLAEQCLLLTYIVNLVQVAATIFGTWTLSKYRDVPCREDKPLRTLVICSWTLLALSLTWTLLCLKWFPNQQGSVEAWVKRLRFVCYFCACLGFETALEPLRKMDLEEDGDEKDASKREEALVEHLAETFHVIFGDVDFTASDRHAALVLATALQQSRRHERIRACLQEGADPQKAKVENTAEEKQFSRALRHSITQKFPTIVTPSNFAKKVNPQMSAQEAADRYTGFSDRVSQADLEEALGYFEYAVAAYYVQDQGLTASRDGDEEEGKEAEGSSEKDEAENKGPEKNEDAPAPGSLAEKPMGDNPPPKNENLADQTAPTYDEHPDPHSHLMLATSNLSRATQGGGTIKLPAVAEIPGKEGTSPRESLAASPASAPDAHSGEGGQKQRLGRSEGAASSAAASSPKCEGGEIKEGLRAGGDDGHEVDNAGNRVTKVDVGEPEEEPGRKDDSHSSGVADAISSGLRGVKQGLKGTVGRGSQTQEKDVELGSLPSGNPIGKMEGVDKTAKKALKGEMQIGSRNDNQVVEEGEEDKVQSSKCGICRSSGPVVTPLDKLDCIYSRADNTILGTLPYMIALDWERRAIVLGVRGTSSLSDALTDAIAQPIPILPWLGDIVTEPDGGLASVHSGILASAAALNHDLEEHGILTALLTGAAVDEEAKEALVAPADVTSLLQNPPLAATLVNVRPFAEKILEAADSAVPAESAEEAGESQGASLAPAPVAATSTKVTPSPFAVSSSKGFEDDYEAKPPSMQSAASTNSAGIMRSASSMQRSYTMQVQGLQSAQELMAQDEDVIQHCKGLREAERLRNEQARRLQRLKSGAGRNSGKFKWLQSGSQRVDEATHRPETRRANSSVLARGPEHAAAESERADSRGSVGLEQLETDRGKSLEAGTSRKPSSEAPKKSNKANKVSFLEKDRRSRSVPHDPAFLDAAKLRLGTIQSGVEAPAEVLRLPVREPSGEAKLGESGAEKSSSGAEKLPKRTDRRFSLGGRDRRFSIGGGERRRSLAAKQQDGQMERAGSIFTGAGRAVRNFYSDARGAFRENDSPPRSPRRKSKSRYRPHDPRRDRLEEMMKNVEDQMKKTFLPKIFKEEQDLRKLEEVAVLEEQQKRRAAFRAKQLKQLEERKLDCRGWQLVLTGHSLGAGVAALLALKLRPRFPDVPIKCWAYCPPGGLVTLGLSNSMAPFCTSVIVGKDGVPRASLGNLSRLVDEVVTALARGRRCKTRVLIRNLTSRGRAKLRRPGEFYDVDRLPEQCLQVLDEYAAGAVKRAEAIGQPVHPPGRVIYCRRLKESPVESSYDAVWVPPQEIMKEGFIISSKMLKDHLCDAVTEALQTSIERLKEAETKIHRPSAHLAASPESSDVDTDTD